MAIETIKAGDYVLSFDEGKKEKSYKKVTDTFVRTTDLIYTVSFVNGEKLETTWNHPFWVLKKSVVRESGQVELGASLVGARYIDSDSLSGENNSSLDGEWISAKDLKAGDVSLTAGGKRLLIASITPSSQSETVYNFSVADNHTYFVGDEGVLVHNSSYTAGTPTGGSESVADLVERFNKENGTTYTVRDVEIANGYFTPPYSMAGAEPLPHPKDKNGNNLPPPPSTWGTVNAGESINMPEQSLLESCHSPKFNQQ